MRAARDAEARKLECQICFERPRDTVLLPCMHFSPAACPPATKSAIWRGSQVVARFPAGISSVILHSRAAHATLMDSAPPMEPGAAQPRPAREPRRGGGSYVPPALRKAGASAAADGARRSLADVAAPTHMRVTIVAPDGLELTECPDPVERVQQPSEGGPQPFAVLTSPADPDEYMIDQLLTVGGWVGGAAAQLGCRGVGQPAGCVWRRVPSMRPRPLEPPPCSGSARQAATASAPWCCRRP
jgi:hypothetical protein